MLLGEVVGPDTRNLAQLQPLGSTQAGVATDHDVIFVDDQRNLESELLNGFHNRLHSLVVAAGILLIGNDIRDRQIYNFHDSLQKLVPENSIEDPNTTRKVIFLKKDAIFRA